MGFVRPLVLSSQTQIPLHGPDALTSRRYARDFKEVHDFGSATGSARTPEQTENALFWTDNTPVQYQAGVRDLVTATGLDIVRSARTFAVLNAAGADAAISCWRAKYDFAFWRPITAIQRGDTDGNPATVADPTWTPLIATPPYPEYPSGHACLTGAYAGGLSALFGARHIDLNVSSAATMTTRHYETARELNDGHHERPHLARDPLPPRDDRRQRPGPGRRGLRAAKRVPAGARARPAAPVTRGLAARADAS